MFVAYPTLVFQLAYPRTESVRIRILLRYIAEFSFCVILQFILVEQYITPLLNNTISGIEDRINRNVDLVNMAWFLLERFLKLSIPNLYIWLLMFAEIFHCHLNILAELTRFGDRRFYYDWWNAVSIRDYWQKWNQPVHNWLLRHLYRPFRKLNISQQNAAILVFVISGIFHEYLIITPIGIPWNGFVTLGFILQIPLISLTDTKFIKDRPTVGNCMFWITSCFTGQPLATLLYFVAASSPTIFFKLAYWAIGRAWGGSVHDEF
jgi:diacylglycerol O-acyltransferase